MDERPTRSDRCAHRSLAAVELTEGGYRLRCAVCGKVGPARKTPAAVRKARVAFATAAGFLLSFLIAEL
jgi:hypothetical protein